MSMQEVIEEMIAFAEEYPDTERLFSIVVSHEIKQIEGLRHFFSGEGRDEIIELEWHGVPESFLKRAKLPLNVTVFLELDDERVEVDPQTLEPIYSSD